VTSAEYGGGESEFDNPYHPQENRVVEQSNRILGNTLRSVLLGRGQEERDMVLPLIMRTYRSTPHSGTQGPSNLLLLS